MPVMIGQRFILALVLRNSTENLSILNFYFCLIPPLDFFCAIYNTKQRGTRDKLKEFSSWITIQIKIEL